MSGCVKITYWDGLSESEAREFVEKTLEDKYGEEFVVKDMTYTGANYYNSSDLLTKCSPKSDEDIVFEVEVDIIGKGEQKKRSMYDTYIQSIVGREMRIKAEQILSKYVKNFAVEVYVRGLPSAYDSKIRSANEATIENFTNAIPEENLSTIWFVLDINEFASDYDRTAAYVEEIVDEYSLTNGCIICYFVSSDIVEECKKKIAEKHTDYDYDLLWDMTVTLNDKKPYFRYYFKANDNQIDVSKYY